MNTHPITKILLIFVCMSSVLCIAAKPISSPSIDIHSTGKTFTTFTKRRISTQLNRVIKSLPEAFYPYLPENITLELGEIDNRFLASPDQALFEPLLVEALSDQLTQTDSSHWIFRPAKPNNIFQSLALALGHQIGQKLLSKQLKIHKKPIKTLFGFYPEDFRRKAVETTFSNLKNYKRNFFYQIALYIAFPTEHQNIFPHFNRFLSDTYGVSWNEKPNFELWLDTGSKLITERRPQANQKSLLFSMQKLKDKPIQDLLPPRMKLTVPKERILGISLLLAGEEDRGSNAVGHTGLVIVVCPGPARSTSVVDCLNNKKAHLSVNPMGETDRYEHSPVKKAFHGGVLARFPFVYNVQLFSEYQDQLSNEQLRDMVVSPPIITYQNGNSLSITLDRIEEIVKNNLTNGYNIFRQSCVHHSRSILDTPVLWKKSRPDHSLRRRMTVLPKYPIETLFYYRERFTKNAEATPLNTELEKLWKLTDKMITRIWMCFSIKEIHPLTRLFFQKRINHAALTLQKRGLFYPARKDGMSSYTRKKLKTKATPLTPIFAKEENLEDRIASIFITLKGYGKTPPQQRLRVLILELNKASSAKEQQNILLSFHRMEAMLLDRLSLFFEKTEFFIDETTKLIRKQYNWPYHLRYDMDVSREREIDDNIDMYDIYWHMCMQNCLSRSFDRYFFHADMDFAQAFTLAQLNPEFMKELNSFTRINQSLELLLNDQAEKDIAHAAVVKHFVPFYNQWHLEWEACNSVLQLLEHFLDDFNQEFIPLEQLLDDSRALTVPENAYAGRKWGIGVDALEEDISKKQTKQRHALLGI